MGNSNNKSQSSAKKPEPQEKSDPISLLKKYTNADTSLFYLKSLGNLLSGNFKYTNIMVKTDEVNKKLEAANAPLRLKMGVLGEFQLKFSVINRQLEKVTINNFILFIQSKFSSKPESEFYLSSEDQKVTLVYYHHNHSEKNKSIYKIA